jgi:D-aminopeptidase
MINRSCAAILALMIGVCATAAQARPPRLTANGFSVNGFSVNGFSVNGFSVNGVSSSKAEVKGVILADGTVVDLK